MSQLKYLIFSFEEIKSYFVSHLEQVSLLMIFNPVMEISLEERLTDMENENTFIKSLADFLSIIKRDSELICSEL